MTESFRGVQPTQSQLPGDIQQLVAAVDALPAEHRDRMLPMVARVLESNRRRRRILNLVQEAISQLRLDMKYLVFDLEATRCERESLRHQLEEGDA